MGMNNSTGTPDIIPEGTRAFVADANLKEIQTLMRLISQRAPDPQTRATLAQDLLCGPTGEGSRRSFADGVVSASDIPPGAPPLALWLGMYPSSVTLLIGETGAGKSSLLYNVGIHGARNESLWGIPFGLSRPLRILYIDPENSGRFEDGMGGLCAQKLDRIGSGKPKNLFFHNGDGVNLATVSGMAELRGYVIEREIDLVILDPIANLFATKDENDNAEAATQMRSLTRLARETRCAVLCCHHTGKDSPGGSNSSNGSYGRGASARLAAAHVGLLFRARSNKDETDDDYGGALAQRTDVCRLQITKNRMDGTASLYLRMAGEDRFTRVKADDWKALRPTSDRRPAADEAQEEIFLLLQDGKVRSRTDIINAMKQEGISRHSVDKALKQMEQSNEVVCDVRPHGAKHYRLPDPPTQDPSV